MIALALVTAALAGTPVAVPPTVDVFARFPRLNQLKQVTRDGHPDENAQMNCIPTSIAAGMRFLTGKEFLPDEIKHDLYGAKYVGPTQIIKYLPWTRAHGVELKVFTSPNPEILVAELRRQLAAGKPVVLTLPGNLDAPPGDLLHPKQITHVAVAAGFDENGNIRVMNPWGGTWMQGSDSFWASRICYGELWAMQRLDGINAAEQYLAQNPAPEQAGPSKDPGAQTVETKSVNADASGRAHTGGRRARALRPRVSLLARAEPTR